jgi:hypothetical protein
MKNGNTPPGDAKRDDETGEDVLYCGSEWCRILSLRDPAALRDGWATQKKVCTP